MPRWLPATLLLAACASSPPPRPPAVVATAPAPAPAPRPRAPDLPPTDGERLGEAARLLADGVALERAALLLASVAPGTPRRDLLLGQLAELTGDDAGAVEAYGRALAARDDEEVRLRRALALERLGRGGEAEADLARLRAPAPPRTSEAEVPAQRNLRPLRPSSR